jgi:hypothetical protein
MTLEFIKDQITQGAALDIRVETTSRSNMSYTYSVTLWYMTEDGKLSSMCLNGTLAEPLGTKLDKHGNLKGSGCGVDRVFLAEHSIRKAIKRYRETDFSTNSNN